MVLPVPPIALTVFCLGLVNKYIFRIWDLQLFSPEKLDSINITTIKHANGFSAFIELWLKSHKRRTNNINSSSTLSLDDLRRCYETIKFKQTAGCQWKSSGLCHQLASEADAAATDDAVVQWRLVDDLWIRCYQLVCRCFSYIDCWTDRRL